jgi:glutathione peroxidase
MYPPINNTHHPPNLQFLGFTLSHLKTMTALYDIVYTDTTGNQVSLGKYKWYIMLIVNTATWCGLSRQFSQLEELYQTYKDKKFVVIGFPSNQFAQQEPVADADMVQTCSLNYGVTFPLSQKILVNWPDTHPLFIYLKEQIPNGLFWQAIKRNFTKFLIDRTGTVRKRYAPTTSPKTIEKMVKTMI